MDVKSEHYYFLVGTDEIGCNFRLHRMVADKPVVTMEETRKILRGGGWPIGRIVSFTPISAEQYAAFENEEHELGRDPAVLPRVAGCHLF